MSFAASNNTDQVKIERLLSALEGVVSARVVFDDNARLVEIHILASHELHPKQIVRNVESALSAGFGLLVDRRVVSVAQLRPDAMEMPAAMPEEPAEEAPVPRRLVLVGFDTTCSAPLDARCSITLEFGGQQITGTGSGANTPQGRAEAAARAFFDALSLSPDPVRLGFEGVALVEANGKTFVLLAAHGIQGRRGRLLTGVAPVTRSPEEAAILAALQATNRCTSRLS
jgi:hypothetical protein